MIASVHEDYMLKVGRRLGVPHDRVTCGFEVSSELAQRFARVILISDLDRMNELINNDEEGS